MAGSAAVAPLAAEDDAPPPPRWDFIAFEVKSWGEPVSSWRIKSLGGGSWTETRKAPTDPLGSYTLVWHEIADDIQRYIALERVLARLPTVVPDYANCTNRMSDLPYGTIRLTKGATTTEIAWNSGCMDEDYEAFVGILKEADTIIAEAGRKGKVLREEPVPTP